MLAFDVGGTKTAITSDLESIEKLPTPTSYEGLINLIISKANEYNERNVGLAIAGTCYGGKVVFNPNMPWLVGKSLVEPLSEEGISIIIENDANAAAIGEFFYGVGRHWRSLLYITISTGIGGGFVFMQSNKGVMWKGLGSALEIGQMIIDRGLTWEALASGKAFEKRAEEKGLSLEEAWKDEELVNEEIHYVAIGLRNAIYTFHPEGIVLGGGVMKGLWNYKSLLMDKLKEILELPYTLRMPKIERESLPYPALYGMYAFGEKPLDIIH